MRACSSVEEVGRLRTAISCRSVEDFGGTVREESGICEEDNKNAMS